MNTLSAVIQDISNELGYNPYEGFLTKDKEFVTYSDAIKNRDPNEINNALVYESLRAIREMPIGNFFEFAKSTVYKDLYIVGLMVEIYRRTHPTNVNTFHFSDSQYVEFDDWQDLLSALEQLKPHYPEFQAYKGIESGVVISYVTMSDKHLLNAWFQRVYNEVVVNGNAMNFADMYALTLVSPQVDGIMSFFQALKVFL